MTTNPRNESADAVALLSALNDLVAQWSKSGPRLARVNLEDFSSLTDQLSVVVKEAVALAVKYGEEVAARKLKEQAEALEETRKRQIGFRPPSIRTAIPSPDSGSRSES